MWKYLIVFTALSCATQARDSIIATLLDNGPTIRGGSITYRVDLYNSNGSIPSGCFMYRWRDNIPGHESASPVTTNTTSLWKVDYPSEIYPVGVYLMEVIVIDFFDVFGTILTSQHETFKITQLLNGKMTITQSNNTLNNVYVSSEVESEIRVDLREADMNYIISKTAEISTFWFIDCQYYGQTNDFTFRYNFTQPDVTKSIEALVVASYDPLITTVTTSTTTTGTPPWNLNSTTASTFEPFTTTTSKPRTNNLPIETNEHFQNISLPYVCGNSSALSPDPEKTYGYFHKTVNVTAPIRNITVEGADWIEPWELLNLRVSCQGSGPFTKCVEFHRGDYNITGEEMCLHGRLINTCKFSILHFFVEPDVYTVLVILKNNISTAIHPLTINVYEDDYDSSDDDQTDEDTSMIN